MKTVHQAEIPLVETNSGQEAKNVPVRQAYIALVSTNSLHKAHIALDNVNSGHQAKSIPANSVGQI